MDRRQFLWNFGGGLGGIALAQMMSGETHFPAKAKRVVQLFMSGAASQCDTFDYKPELIRRNGEKFDPGRQGGAVPKQSGRGDEEPVGMEAARPVREMDQRPGAAHRILRGRYRLRAFDDGEIERARSGDVHAEYRLRAAGLPVHGVVGLLRAGQHERESADLHRAAGCARLRAERAGELERRLSARVASGHDDPREQRQSDLRPVSAEAGGVHHAGERGGERGSCCAR